MKATEFNFDGLVGPSHNHAGLSSGNVASTANRHSVANPRAAALQGLAKMQALAQRGFAQALLPPHLRPDVSLLRAVGFSGSDAQVIDRAAREAPTLLAAAYSAAPMWTANAATVSPAADTVDGRTHFTVANLNNKLHRSREHRQTQRSLEAIFADSRYFAIHPALPATPTFGDEGAANHGRLAKSHGAKGIEFFVHGRSEFDAHLPRPNRYPARQTLEAAQAVARLHGLDPKQTVHLRQNPAVIDQGVFHNDVIAVSNGPVLLYHEQAFFNEQAGIAALREAMASIGAELLPIRVSSAAVSVQDAIESYLFNSQLLTRPDGGMILVIPAECEENSTVAAFLKTLLEGDNPIDELMYFDLRQSMRNGGGPACLRLRVVLAPEQAMAMHQGVILTDLLYEQLVAWINRYYRDRLAPEDLADPSLAIEIHTALEALATILQLPFLYDGADEDQFS